MTKSQVRERSGVSLFANRRLTPIQLRVVGWLDLGARLVAYTDWNHGFNAYLVFKGGKTRNIARRTFRALRESGVLRHGAVEGTWQLNWMPSGNGTA